MDEFGDIAKRTGVAFHHQLYTVLVRALGEGFIAAGSALPTETELMERFSVSRDFPRMCSRMCYADSMTRDQRQRRMSFA